MFCVVDLWWRIYWLSLSLALSFFSRSNHKGVSAESFVGEIVGPLPACDSKTHTGFTDWFLDYITRVSELKNDK